jgi:hypothetical protein
LNAFDLLPIGIYLGFGFWELGFNMFMSSILDKSQPSAYFLSTWIELLFYGGK